MSRLLHLGEIVGINARLYPDKVAARASARALTFRQWHERACRLANALLALPLAKGDRVAVLAHNALEWLEIYAAVANAGLAMVPINFRLVGREIRYIVENCEARAIIVGHDLVDRTEGIRADLPIPPPNYVVFGGAATPAGYKSYEDIIAAASAAEPAVEALPQDLFALIYTSGTTGNPKGAMRSHASLALSNYATLLAFGFRPDDSCLLVMPLCHANSLFFAAAFAATGAASCVYDRRSVDPEHLLRTLASERVTFTSLVPTHYVMMLGLPERVRAACNVEAVTRLLVSSAPVRRETKLAILEQFPRSGLYELYGSTEAGWVTMLRPEEQLTRLASIGRELFGSGPIRLLDETGGEVAEGQPGELFSRTPWAFEGYWKEPAKTAQAFRGPYLSVGDMARRQEGYYYLVDRKSNMIISGGENVYPSEVEAVLGAHPKVKDVAVVGRPHDTWGEAVHAVIVLREGESATEAEVLAWCTQRIAGYKRPKSVSFIRDEDMPRTATGKIQHRLLKGRY